MSDKLYDIIVIGGGPAGFTAALYGVRAGLSTLVIEKFSAGGQMTQTSMIDNYPGFDEGVDGFTLGMKMQNGALRFGAEFTRDEIVSVNLDGTKKRIIGNEKTYFAKTVIIATGADHRHLGLPEEESLIGKGVGYCAACDGMFYRGKNVAVIGGGNSAVSDALLLSKICEKVYLIHRRDTLRAAKVYHEPLHKTTNIEIIYNSRAEEILSHDRVSGLVISNTLTDEKSQIDCQGVFISIGRVPQTDIFKNQLSLDNNGYIIADETTETNISGVFAAGDVRTKYLRQVVTAVADGAVAAQKAEEYITRHTS